jgi:coenzyme F420-reducing hydrogenase delta subunit
MFTVSEVLVEVSIENRIRASDMSQHEQDQFVHMLSYMTLDEQEELRALL